MSYHINKRESIYLRDQINNLEPQKTKCTNHVLTLSKRIDELREMVDVYESSLNEKRDDMAFLNQEQRRLDNLSDTNNDNKNNESPDTEIFYASGSWHNLIP
ncbi:MAG: hypothetical protein WCF23_15560 [Candidatus Nitrosopolaris sp.]